MSPSWMGKITELIVEIKGRGRFASRVTPLPFPPPLRGGEGRITKKGTKGPAHE